MGNGFIGKVLYFWIFILGGVAVAWIMGFIEDEKSFGWFIGAMAIAYIVWNVARSLGRSKREAKTAASRQPVHTGRTHKKKKKR